MSTSLPTIELPDGTRKLARKLTYKEARYVAERLKPETGSKAEAARKAGFPTWMVHDATRAIETGEVAKVLEELQGTLAEHAVEAALIDATEIHEYLTDALRAKMSDIRNDDHSYKPRSEWPEIWDRLEEGGDVDVQYEYKRSTDGKDEEKRGGWDQVGKVVSVKLKFASRVKLLELAMKHKAVDAMVQQKQGDVNVLFVNAETARKVVGAKKRLGRIIDSTTATTTSSGPENSASSEPVQISQQADEHKI